MVKMPVQDLLSPKKRFASLAMEVSQRSLTLCLPTNKNMMPLERVERRAHRATATTGRAENTTGVYTLELATTRSSREKQTNSSMRRFTLKYCSRQVFDALC